MTPTGRTGMGRRTDLRGQQVGGSYGTHALRYSVEFKLRMVEPHLAGEGSAKGLAGQAGLSHALLLRWTEQFRRGALSVALQQLEQPQEAQQHVAALERKVGQLVIELDLLKKGLIAVPAASGGP